MSADILIDSPTHRDEPPVLEEPKAGHLMITYAPTGDAEVYENLPRFSWIPVIDADARYVLRVSRDHAGDDGVRGHRDQFFRAGPAVQGWSIFLAIRRPESRNAPSDNDSVDGA